jgi:hypothetical protein
MRIFFTTSLVRSLFFLVITTLAFWPAATFASFGITPPYVRNTSLTRNSTYEQQILLVRGNPNEDLKAEINIDAPEIQSWISIKEGNSIPMPRGAQKVPMTVTIKVPADADFADYTGKIRIRTLPADNSAAEGVVSISLGAQVDIDLSVIDKVIEDFKVRRISVSDLNEGHKFGWLYFPGKIVFPMLIENTGNVDIAPSKVLFKIYDHAGAVMLEQTQQSGSITKIKPYATEEVVANLPTHLPAGSYLARYTIFNGSDIKQEGELNLSILPYGTLQTAGYGFMGLSIAHKISLLLPVLTLVIVVLFIIHNRRSRSRRTT